MKDALLEIGTENMPARFIAPALEQMQVLAAKLLGAERLVYKGVKTYGTFRRLALVVEGLEEKSEPMSELVFGPPAKIWKDANGQYTKQSEGFARKNDTTPDKLIIAQKGGCDHLAVNRCIKSEKAEKILEKVFPEIIRQLQFPKNMIWEESKFRFARPIKNFCALYGAKVVNFELAGVKSSRKTQPLWALGGDMISIPEPAAYAETLRNHLVIVDIAERKKALLDALTRTSQILESRVELDDSLVMETVFLTENPVPVTGSFSKDFLRLPSELITTVLKKQLKFFPVLNDSGELVPGFIAVRDGVTENQNEVRTGYEAVVVARLSDAVFFFDNDLEKPLDKMLGKLDDLLFIESVGSMLKKAERVERLALWLADELGGETGPDQETVRLSARYAYADLGSSVVYEFPELQGYMGGEYVQASKENSSAALALKEFYYPLSAKSPIPMTVEGAVVSLSGKIDTLVAAFAAGMIPTGSEDPNALRRQALGAVRILLEKNLLVSIPALLEKSWELVAKDFRGCLPDKITVLAQLEDFIRARAETVLGEKGFKFDEVRAVFSVQYDESGLPVNALTLSDIYRRLTALHTVRQDPDFEAISLLFKRVANIIKKSGRGTGGGVDETLFSPEETAEKELYLRLVTVKGSISPLIACTTEPTCGQFETALKEMLTLKPFVDRFFDDIMVMVKDEKVRDNRLALLGELHSLLRSVADLEKLQ
ncbi:MAG: glycine--tRNA ligase subunit beta [Elusimicrobiaceae bacterium]